MTHITNCPGCKKGLTVKPYKNSLIYFKGYCIRCKESFVVCNMEQVISKMRGDKQ
ncbi:hypothetical protein [Salinicoccus roseus]|uniref:hypothetical protein n=1 Tax=Salinicoccus roseus TaxID=45670 RepID=UPI002300F628|nr:hypothetical protein [Salinicoccus roseus]